MLGSLTAASQEHSLQPAQHHGKLRGLHNIVTPSLTLESEQGADWSWVGGSGSGGDVGVGFKQRRVLLN